MVIVLVYIYMYTSFIFLVLSYHRPVQPVWIENLDDQVKCNSHGLVISIRLFVHVWNISDCQLQLSFCSVSDSCTLGFKLYGEVLVKAGLVEYGQHVGAWYFNLFLMSLPSSHSIGATHGSLWMLLHLCLSLSKMRMDKCTIPWWWRSEH